MRFLFPDRLSILWISFQEDQLIMTREEADIHSQADDNEPHPQSDSEHLRVGSIMVTSASVQHRIWCVFWRSPDTADAAIMYRTRNRAELWAGFNLRRRFCFFLFWFLIHLGLFTRSHSELSHLPVCDCSSPICRCCCHLTELGQRPEAKLACVSRTRV